MATVMPMRCLAMVGAGNIVIVGVGNWVRNCLRAEACLSWGLARRRARGS